MGLAIVHGIVAAQKGATTVRSTPGEGSVFEVYLPRHAAAGMPRVTAVAPTLCGSEHILVVDDEPQLIALWEEMLQQFGYQVTAFEESPRALEAFHRHPQEFDLALLDQTMPHMTGIELAKLLLAARPELPIILATGFSESVSAEEARSAGVREFVYKPILGNELTMAIRRALGHGPETAAGGE